MTEKHENYPNKEDFEPNTGKHLKGGENKELPLADPSESSATGSQTFKDNEGMKKGEHEQSAFGVNKDALNDK